MQYKAAFFVLKPLTFDWQFSYLTWLRPAKCRNLCRNFHKNKFHSIKIIKATTRSQIRVTTDEVSKMFFLYTEIDKGFIHA